MAPARARLPNRRDNRHATVQLGDQEFNVWIGLDPATGRPCEVFINAFREGLGGKEGSHLDTILADAGVALSIAIQRGVPIAELAKSVGRAPNIATAPGSQEQLAAGAEPASPIGAALDLLLSLEPPIQPKRRQAYWGTSGYSHY